ncbi:hypothetical protein ABCR94_00305 [Streptomyces sp. 21So2-11]|uniref:hypothetical protein n=1 Tax=Streptomyces sp. 21So2-11 TaxID=3144408 RepID=UPI00321C27A5
MDGKPAAVPYTVLYPQGGLVDGAPLADASEDAHLVYQVTVVAGRTDQAEWLADRVRRAFLDRESANGWEHPITAHGIEVWSRELMADEGPDHSMASEGVVTSIQRYQLDVSSTPL